MRKTKDRTGRIINVKIDSHDMSYPRRIIIDLIWIYIVGKGRES